MIDMVNYGFFNLNNSKILNFKGSPNKSWTEQTKLGFQEQEQQA